MCLPLSFFFFFNDTATTEIYTLSLHDALPICPVLGRQLPRRLAEDPGLGERGLPHRRGASRRDVRGRQASGDRKSTRLNSSHLVISYAVFCLKKKKNSPSRHCNLNAVIRR